MVVGLIPLLAIACARHASGPLAIHPFKRVTLIILLFVLAMSFLAACVGLIDRVASGVPVGSESACVHANGTCEPFLPRGCSRGILIA